MKRYQFILNGETIFKNVSPGNEDMFFNKYGKYNPTLVSEEPGKSQGTSQSQNNQKENTESNLADGSSESVDPNDFENTQEKATWIEQIPGVGKNHVTDFIGDLYRSAKGGVVQGQSLAPSLDLFWKGKNISDEELRELVERGRAMEEYGQTDEMLAFNERYAEIMKSSQDLMPGDDEGLSGFAGSTLAFMRGWWENKSVMMQYSAQSLANMAYSAATNPGKAAAGAWAGVGTALAAGQLGPQVGLPEEIITVPTGAIAGAMGAISATMETGFTTAELVQGQAEEAGLNWSQMSDDERVEWYRKVANDKELFDELTSKALARGLTIGAIDAVTAAALPGASKAVAGRVATTSASRLTGVSRVGVTATGETVGGMTSEYFGQKAAGQEINAQEILTEGFADKTLTGIEAGRALVSKTPKYSINGQPMNGAEFSRALSLMDDEAYSNADIVVENSPTVKKVVDDRTNSIGVDLSIDSRVSDVKDRSELIKLETRKKQLEKTNNKIELQQIDESINEIMSKYKDSKVDVTTENRKQAVALAIKDKVQRLYNKNLKFAEDAATKIGKQFKVAKDEKEYIDAINEYNSQNPGKEQINIKDAANADGLILGDTIIINEAVAKKSGQINVGAHEVLHGVVAKHFKNIGLDGQKKLISSFKKALTTEQFNYIKNIIDARNKAGENLDINSTDEWLAIMSDGITKGDITFNEGVFSKIMNFIQEILRKLGINKEFKNGRQVYNFMKDYQASIKKGTISSRALNLADGGTRIEDVKFSKDATQAVDNLAINPDTKKRYTKKEWDDGGADRAIEEIKKKRNDNNFINEGYLDGLIGAKYKIRPVPDRFIDDVIGSNFFINHIRSFNPEVNDSLFGWVNSQIRNKAASVFNKNEQGKLPKGVRTVEADARTTEGQERVQLEDTDTNIERIENEEINLRDEITHQTKPEVRERKSKFRNEIGITRTGRVFREVKKALRTAESIVNPKKFLKTFEKTVSDSLFDFMKVYFPDTNSMIKYRVAILESIPIPTLVQMQKQLTEKIFVKSYGRLTNKTQISDFVYGRNESGKNPSKKKLLTDDILNDSEVSKARRKAGVPVYERLKPTVIQWQNYLNATEKGKRQTAKRSGTKGNNRIKILEEAAKAIGRDAAPQNLTTEFLQNYIQEKGLQDTLTVDQVRDEINKTIDRPSDLKFSKTPGVDVNGMNDAVNIKTSDLVKALFALEDRFNLKSKDRFTDKEFIETSQEVFDELKITMPEFFDVFKRGTTRSSRTTMGKVGFFKMVAGEYNKLIQIQHDKTEYSGTGKLLDKDIVKVDKKGNVLINIGTKKQKQNWITGREFAKQQRKKVNVLLDFFRKAKRHIDQFPSHKWFFVSFILDSQNNQSHLLRISAPLLGLPIDKNGKVIFDLKVEQEHMMPASDIGKLFLWAIKNNKIEELALVIQSSYAQIALLEEDNVKLQQSKLSSSMTNEQEGGFYTNIMLRVLKGEIKSTNGLLSIARYALAGVNLNRYKLIENGKTITEQLGIDVKNFNDLTAAQQERVVESQNKNLIEYLKGNISLDTAKERVTATSSISYSKSISQSNIDKNTQRAFDNASKTIRLIKDDLEKKGYKFVDMDNKGMSTFDFDETLIIDGENFVVATNPITKQTEQISSGDWPVRGPELQALGYTFNFDDFVNVRGGVDGPLLQKMRNQIKKYGPENVFILTARPQTADVAIQGWLESKGIKIPFKNITGLANSTGQAKANWMLEKFAEGYNDMYFVDDALSNVKAVKDVLDQLDIKSKVVQAKIKFSKTASQEFNNIIEESQGTKADRVISYQEALKMGRNKNWFRLFVPPSAEDFKGLLYRFLGRGKKGDAHMAWFKKNLLTPFAKGIREWNIYKEAISRDYKSLRKAMPSVKKILNKKVAGTIFTVDSAIRVYLWDKAGFDIPGITPEAKAKLIKYVNDNPMVMSFADTLSSISRLPDGYSQPGQNWSLETIATDLNNIVNKIGRKQFLQNYLANVEAIFTPDNMNKIQALYGIEFREALENILYRMENGTNRPQSNDRNVNAFLGWINGSIGAIMFFNMRSALLQTISTVNFVNWSDNNMFKAAKAFANQPQFWKDFAMLFNSPQLRQRRKGLQTDVSASELANTFAEGGNTYLQKANAVIKYLLQIGFTPTQVADSFAIALGGASFYRNRFNTYKKQGLSDAKAKEKAMLDFQEIAEETQQSSREDLVSQQQASTLGRLILAFQNVTMQYTRLTKKALFDLINGRGDAKTNVSKLLYYGMVQNLVFGALQSALVFVMFGHDEEDDKTDKKIQRVANGALDSLLRGTGIYGAIAAAIKNTALRYKEEREKGWGRDDGRVIVEALQLSPPIGSKIRKIYNALKTEQYNKGVSEEIGARIENPNLVAISNVIEALTNIPIARIIKKANNVEEAVTGNHAMWQRVALFMGWSRWDIGVKDEELEAAKKAVKDKKKKVKDKNRVRCVAIKKSGGRCKNTTKNSNKKCYAHQ